MIQTEEHSIGTLGIKREPSNVYDCSGRINMTAKILRLFYLLKLKNALLSITSLVKQRYFFNSKKYTLTKHLK